MLSVSPATRYVLKGFLPYTKDNVLPSFKPSQYFHDLERKSRVNERTLRSAYYRAIKTGLIEVDGNGIPRLTEKGRTNAKPYKPSVLGKSAYLLVIFDVPEEERSKRSHLRTLLKELSFTQIQRSVWASRYDHRAYLTAEIKTHGLENFVMVYEASQLLV